MTVSRVSTIQDFNHAISTGSKIDGGVEYFGHGWNGNLYPGEGTGDDTNINSENINQLSGANLSKGATVTLNSCNSGALGEEGADSIAQIMANQLGVNVKGSKRPLGFTGVPGRYIHGSGALPPASGPLYMTPPSLTDWQIYQPQVFE